MDLNLLKGLSIFQQLTEGQYQNLDAASSLREYAPGAAILLQGTRRGGFHVIISGSVRVMLEGDPRVQVAVLGRGEYFGEIAAITGDPHGATVEAVAPTMTIEFTREGLLGLLECSPGLNRHVLETLAQRVKRTNQRLQEVAVREAALARFLSAQEEEMHGELIGFSPAGSRLLEAARALAPKQNPVLLAGEVGTGKAHVAAWLHLQSGRRQWPMVVLSAAEWTEEAWERHLRLARGGTLLLKDLQLLPEAATQAVLAWLRTAGPASVRFLGTCTVGSADQGGTPLPYDPAALAACHCAVLTVPPLRERREDIPALALNFLRQAGRHPKDESLTGVIRPEALRLLCAFPYLQGNVKELAVVLREAAVLAEDGPIGVEHLRLGRYRRRQRRPTVGLALGGGVVRGAAHIGVIQALLEAGIPIDCVAGTSAGALVGGLYAAGVGPATLERLARGMSWVDLVRPVVPLDALAHNRPTINFVERQVGPITFADLRLPFAAVAGDFRTAAPVILREGRLSEAIQASSAIPGLIRPVRRGNQLLVDGFVVSTVPALVARSLGADLVIAVDVGMPALISGLSFSLWLSLLRAMDILSRRQVERELDWADVVISATDPAISAYSFRSVPSFLAAGVAAGRQMLPQIRRHLAGLAEELV